MIKALGVACLFFTLCACGKERPDPRLGELTTPVHVTVRVIDAPVERTCTGTLTEQATCMFSRAERQGCVYVEVGAAADTPEVHRAPEPARCFAIRGSVDRAVLSDQPGRKAKLTLDPTGSQVVIEVADGLHVLYLRHGHLAIARKLESLGPGSIAFTLRADGSVDWSRVPPFLSMLDQAQLLALTEPELDNLLAETPDGKAALKDSLVALMASSDITDKAFIRAMEKLDAPDRTDLRQRLLQEVTNGNAGALDWFDAHPKEQGADFVTALAEAVENSNFDISTGVTRLLRLDPKRAEELACDDLERRWHESTASPFDYSGESMPLSAATLAVIVKRRSKCPWVLPMLLRTPCSSELRCDPDIEDKKPTPLCTEAQTEKALERTLRLDDDLDEDQSLEDEHDWGALLVAAARVQGPLPPDFLRAEARRLYAQTFTNAENDVCKELTLEPADWACQLPKEINTAFTEGCTLVLDDANKTMTLSSPAPDPETE